MTDETADSESQFDPANPETAWFGSGLRFVCTGCGKCCTGSSGSVYLTQPDLQRLAGHLRLTVGAFVKRYTRQRLGRRALIDNHHSDACIFLKDRQCTVYDARPQQCRTYPWWLSNIRDRESWEEAAEHCEGINHPTATLIPASAILEQCLIEAENDALL